MGEVDREITDFDDNEIMVEFKRRNGLYGNLMTDMKLDLFIKHQDKISLQDLEQFFQSKGLEIV